MGIEDRIYTGLKHLYCYAATANNLPMGIEDRIYTGLKLYLVIIAI